MIHQDSSDLMYSLVLAPDDFIDTSFEDSQTVADIILELQAKIAALENKLVNCQEKRPEAEEENAGLAGRQFPLNKIKHDNGICIMWINFFYFKLKDSFPFPSGEFMRKNMPQEFANTQQQE